MCHLCTRVRIALTPLHRSTGTVESSPSLLSSNLTLVKSRVQGKPCTRWAPQTSASAARPQGSRSFTTKTDVMTIERTALSLTSPSQTITNQRTTTLTRTTSSPTTTLTEMILAKTTVAMTTPTPESRAPTTASQNFQSDDSRPDYPLHDDCRVHGSRPGNSRADDSQPCSYGNATTPNLMNPTVTATIAMTSSFTTTGKRTMKLKAHLQIISPTSAQSRKMMFDRHARRQCDEPSMQGTAEQVLIGIARQERMRSPTF